MALILSLLEDTFRAVSHHAQASSSLNGAETDP